MAAANEARLAELSGPGPGPSSAAAGSAFAAIGAGMTADVERIEASLASLAREGEGEDAAAGDCGICCCPPIGGRGEAYGDFFGCACSGWACRRCLDRMPRCPTCRKEGAVVIDLTI